MLKKLQLEDNRQFILLVFIIFLKFLFVRSLLFENINILHTIFVEIGYLLIVLGLIEFLPFQKTKYFLYFLVNLIFSTLLLTVLIYHSYFGNIVTFHAFSLVNQVGAIKDSIYQLVNPVYLILFVDFFILGIYKLVSKKPKPSQNPQLNLKLLVPIVVLGISLVSFHFMSQKENLIENTVVAAEKQGILTYELLATIDLFSSTTRVELTEDDVLSLPAKILQLKQLELKPSEELLFHGIAKDKNIIVIQAEAFQEFGMNLVVDGREVTPFLNSLLEESLYFPHTFQQIGAGNTSDAEFMFNTASYPGAREPASELYGDRKIPSLPRLLKEEEYKSLTFHANDVTFWNRDQLYPALGFDKYYDITFFEEDDIIGMGPSDEHLYKQAFPELEKLANKNERFYAQFITLSSHRPFEIPEGKEVVELPERFADTQVGDYLKSLYYSDWALKEFVDDLKEANMWQDTVFVFYGDHFGLQPDSLSKKDYELLNEILGHEYTYIDQFNIPFFITLPGENVRAQYETTSGQIDMMPTLANLLGLSLDDSVHFGQDVTNYPDNLLGGRYYMPYGSFFYNDVAFKPHEGFHDGSAFNIDTREKIDDVSIYEEEYNRVLHLIKLADDYNNSLPVR